MSTPGEDFLSSCWREADPQGEGETGAALGLQFVAVAQHCKGSGGLDRDDRSADHYVFYVGSLDRPL